MKFNCDRCQTRYSIGDDKVRGKVLKIRCKTCGNIVVVREATSSMQVPEASAGVGAAAAMSSSAVSGPSMSGMGTGVTGPLPSSAPQRSAAAGRGGDVDWYVAIKGKQHGPAKQDDVVRLFREGKITDRSYLWNEGMTAWTRLKDVPAFAHLAAAAAAESTSPRRPPPPPPPSEEQQQGAEIIRFDEARRAREAQQGVSAVTNDPFAAVATQGVGGDGAPRDSTRVFIMQAGLADRGKKHRRYAVAAASVFAVLAGALVLDYQGVIEIPGLHSVVNVVAKREDTPRPVVNLAEWDSAEEDPKLKCQLNPNPEECVRQTLASNEKKRARKKAIASGGGGVGGMNLEGAFNTGEGGAGTIDRKTANELGEMAGLSADEKGKLLSLQNDAKQLKSPTLPTSSQTTAVAGADISAENVSKVVKEHQTAIQDCIEKSAKTGDAPRGKHYLVVSIEPNGKVSGARFANGAVNASQAGECITKSARKWKFAPFPGPTTDVEIPLVLSLN